MNNKPLLSIAIPSYEAKGFGVSYLEKNFNILLNQTFQDFEVVISDNSKDDNILNLTYKYNRILDIKYFKNHEIGMSKNTNLIFIYYKI